MKTYFAVSGVVCQLSLSRPEYLSTITPQPHRACPTTAPDPYNPPLRYCMCTFRCIGYSDARSPVGYSGASGEVGLPGDQQQGARVRIEHLRLDRRRRLPKMGEGAEAGVKSLDTQQSVASCRC